MHLLVPTGCQVSAERLPIQKCFLLIWWTCKSVIQTKLELVGFAVWAGSECSSQEGVAGDSSCCSGNCQCSMVWLVAVNWCSVQGWKQGAYPNMELPKIQCFIQVLLAIPGTSFQSRNDAPCSCSCCHGLACFYPSCPSLFLPHSPHFGPISLKMGCRFLL